MRPGAPTPGCTPGARSSASTPPDGDSTWAGCSTRSTRCCRPAIVVRALDEAAPRLRRPLLGHLARRTATRSSTGRSPTRSWPAPPGTCPTPLDLRALRLAADPLIGEHDFSSFCRRPEPLPDGTPALARPGGCSTPRWHDLGDGHPALRDRGQRLLPPDGALASSAPWSTWASAGAAGRDARHPAARDRHAAGQSAPPPRPVPLGRQLLTPPDGLVPLARSAYRCRRVAAAAARRPYRCRSPWRRPAPGPSITLTSTRLDPVRTYTPKASEIDRAWHVVDAEGLVLGRLATEVARLLRGKHKPTFTPAPRHRRPRHHHQRRQGRAHLGQGRAQDGVPPLRLPRRHQVAPPTPSCSPTSPRRRCAAPSGACSPRTASAARCSASSRSTPAPTTPTPPSARSHSSLDHARARELSRGGT